MSRRARRRAVLVLLFAGLPVASPRALPALVWPAGTQVQVVRMNWFGAPAQAQVAVIPLPVAAALDALVAAADAPWQVTVSGGRLVIAPSDDAWRLVLTAQGEHTGAVLSQLDVASAQATTAPTWLGAGWAVRVASGADPARQWVLTHPHAAQHMRGAVLRDLHHAGWQQLERVSESVSRWRRGSDRMWMVLVALDEGTGLFVQEEGR